MWKLNREEFGEISTSLIKIIASNKKTYLLICEIYKTNKVR